MTRLAAIGFIWLGCAIAWLTLGSTIVVRSGESSGALAAEVAKLWGPPMVQRPPTARVWVEPPLGEAPPPAPPTAQTRPAPGADTSGREPGVAAGAPAGAATGAGAPQSRRAPLDRSDVEVWLELEHRRKGLLWFATYGVDFRGTYGFVNEGTEPRTLFFTFPLPGAELVYDGFTVLGDDGSVIDAEVSGAEARWSAELGPGEPRSYTVRYRSRGTSSWGYGTPSGVGDGVAQVKNFRLAVTTNFHTVDFPAGTISPSTHGPTADGWRGEWSFDSLVGGAAIGLDLPKKLNPGPLASKITFFAPVSLLFFFFVVAILATARGKGVHPMNYFFIGCAFFAFHLLFAYLLDHVALGPAFAAAAAVSLVLVCSYARLFVGWRFALVEMGLAQLIYLVLFSFTFFWTGFTGLAVTVGAIVTLFVIMQITGRIDWARTFAPTSRPPIPPGQAAYAGSR